jgi:hypothetical protein
MIKRGGNWGLGSAFEMGDLKFCVERDVDGSKGVFWPPAPSAQNAEGMGHPILCVIWSCDWNGWATRHSLLRPDLEHGTTAALARLSCPAVEGGAV